MTRFEFVRVGPANTVTGRVWAESIHEAARLMVTGPSEYLTSAASHAIGVSRAVKAALTIPPKPPNTQHRFTAEESRLANKRRHERKPERRSSKTEWAREQRAAKRAARTSEERRVALNHQREAMREARAGSPRGRHQPRPL